MSIKQLLQRHAYIGVKVYNQKNYRLDRETGGLITKLNPRREWITKWCPELATVPRKLFLEVKRQMAQVREESPITGRKASRNQRKATTLLSGTMYCGCCGEEIKLTRSTSKYKVMGCVSGYKAQHGCTMKSQKSTGIIERAVLGFLRDKLLTPDIAEKLVADANAYLAAEASKPRKDTTPLRARVKELTLKRDRLLDMVEQAVVEPKSVMERIASYDTALADLKEQIRTAETENRIPPPTIDGEDVLAAVTQIRELLNQDPALVAPVIRSLTGPIAITERKHKHKRGAAWIATFTPDLRPQLAKMAKETVYLDSGTWEYLNRAIWTNQSPVTLVIDERPLYERYTDEVMRLKATGKNWDAIVASVPISEPTAVQAWRFATYGTPSGKLPPGRKKRKWRAGEEPKYVSHAAEVGRLKDVEGLSYEKIGSQLGIHRNTAMFAYQHYLAVG